LFDIQIQIQELYGAEVSESLISNITEAVIEDVKIWQSRPLESVYAIVFFDCFVVKVRQDKRIINKSGYVDLSIDRSGMSDTIVAVYPKTEHRLCIVHKLRNSLKFVSYKDRKLLAVDLKPIYTAATEDQARMALETFFSKWDKQYPQIAKSWCVNGEQNHGSIHATKPYWFCNCVATRSSRADVY